MAASAPGTLISKRPELFAAAMPLCGAGNPALAPKIAGLPIWAFHGAADPVIRVDYSRAMIAAIKKAGGHPRYSEYKGVGHEVWIPAFAEPGMVEWPCCAAPLTSGAFEHLKYLQQANPQ